METADTIICNAYLVSIPKLDAKILYGSVVEDFKGRFAIGSCVRTSEIISMDMQSQLFHTRYSTYLVKGNIKEITVNIREFKLIHKGVHPSDVVVLFATLEAKKNIKH